MEKYMVVIEGIADYTETHAYFTDDEDVALKVYMHSEYGERREMYVYNAAGYKPLYR